jgi:hypothetical protein
VRKVSGGREIVKRLKRERKREKATRKEKVTTVR